jgi:dienelactone hydrolase
MRCSSASIARSETTLRRVVSERRLGGLRSAGATLAAAIALAVILIQTPGRAAARTVTFKTDDGVMLTGTWYETGRQAPAVVLVHMQHRTRKDWDALASRLAAEGIGTLTFDLRGHGESGGATAADGQVEAFLQDVTAARRFVINRSDVAPRRVGIGGASLGATLAVLDAAQATSVSSLALLSISTEYRGLRVDAALKKYSGRALLVYSDDDPYAQRSARDLIKLQGSTSTTRETLVLHHAGHGTNMLSADPGLIGALIDWFKRTL